MKTTTWGTMEYEASEVLSRQTYRDQNRDSVLSSLSERYCSSSRSVRSLSLSLGALGSAACNYQPWKRAGMGNHLEFYFEELCRCCKKEVKFTRDIVTNNGYAVCSAILFLFVEELVCVQYEVEIGKMLIFTGRKLFITASLKTYMILKSEYSIIFIHLTTFFYFPSPGNQCFWKP